MTTGYFGRPVVKEPVWIWSVPAYFFTGGAAGAAAVLAALARPKPELAGLARSAGRLAAGGAVLGAGLLVIDLGRPERFLNMLRVFRPTSAMSVGSWTLAAFGAASSAALLPGAVGRRAGTVAGALGLPLSTYTGVLLGDTSLPAWRAGRSLLPALFGASAVSSAASLLALTPLTRREREVAARFGTLGKAAELAACIAFERALAAQPALERSLSGRPAGALWRVSKGLTAASLLLEAAGSRRSGVRRLGALLGAAGSLALRYAVFFAGKASARDPEATFALERTTAEPAARRRGSSPAGAAPLGTEPTRGETAPLL